MTQYKIFRKDNYIFVVQNTTQETQYGFTKEVFVDKSNVNIPSYRIFNVKDFNDNTSLNISQILKEDGTPYTQSEFETFYTQNTGNFNSGGNSPGVQSVTGNSVDNTDPQNPVINAVEEAPEDGNLYGRQDGEWQVITGGGSGVQSVSGAGVDNTDASNPVIRNYVKSNESLVSTRRKDDSLYGILDQYTGEEIVLNKVTGTPTVDNIIYFQVGSEYFKRYYENKINVKWFGAKGDGTTDDTVSIQNAINAVNSLGGGVVYFPNGTYYINGALDTNSQAQIYFPLNSIGNSISLKTIKLLGETPPNQYSNPFQAAGANDHPNTGVILKSNLLSAGSVIGCRAETVSWGLFNFIHPNIENISVRVRSLTGSTDVPAVSTAINMGAAAYFDAKFIEVCTTSQMYACAEPASTSIGIIMPKNNNFALCTLSNFNVYGFYIGVDCYEHTSMNEYLIDACVIGFNMNTSFHSINATKGCIARCRYNIRCQSNSKFHIGHITLEDDYLKSIPTPAWNTTLYDVLDMDNTSAGYMRINIVRSNGGTDNSIFKINSTGSKVIVEDLRGVSLTKTPISFANIMAYWPFQNLNDISGNMTPTTPVNSPTFTTGKVGNALTLNSASSQYLNVSSELSNTGVFTICGWFKVNTTAAAFQTLFNKGDATLREYNCYYTKSTNTVTFVNYNGTSVDGSVSVTITPGTWFFLCCEIISNSIKIAINDGAPVVANILVPSSNTIKDLLIGSAEGGGSTLDGQVDELCFFNRQLNYREKGYLYNNGLGNSLIN